MARRLTVVETRGGGETDPIRALAVALAPHLRELLGVQAGERQLVDVLKSVPGPRRTIMRAARSGKIAGAVRVGRRWLAPRVAIDAWLRDIGPRAMPTKEEEEEDEFEPLRRRLAGGQR